MRRKVSEVRVSCPLVVSAAALLMLLPTAIAQSGSNILLVVNDNSPASLEIGQFYAAKRAVPPENVLRLKVEDSGGISRESFERRIEVPISAWLGRNQANDRILYIVLTKGIPLRIIGTGGPEGTVSSVDSELALLYRKQLGKSVLPAGPIRNPYYLGTTPLAQARPFTHEHYDIYLVSRLDGFTPADVRGLIERGLTPVRQGKIVLDEKQSLNETGNTWLAAAAGALRDSGFRDVVHDTSEKVLSGQADVLGYYSWGSNAPENQERDLNLRFVAGALAAMFVNSDARTFSEPPVEWKPGPWENPAYSFGGSPQSLSGDLIRQGITGVAGHVAEPYLQASVRPQILFPSYLAGFNLIESFYLAMPYLSWQTVVVGDPLCAPFRAQPLSQQQIDRGLDPATEQPFWFSRERVKFYVEQGIRPEVASSAVRGEGRFVRGDDGGAREALEEATALDGRLLGLNFMLAGLYEKAKEYDKAVARYRKILGGAPGMVPALNNLAYALGVYLASPREALPLAERAYGLAPNSPAIADTLGWIHHLLGDDTQASRFLGEALGLSPKSSDIQFHAAVVFAAVNDRDAARRALARALELDPELQNREDVRSLNEKLSNGANP